ncbi:MAG: type IV pilus modification PilV family protein [Microgenomates group bacterium]
MLTKNKAFSLIEVLVFVSILMVFFVSALSVVAFSLKNLKSSEYKILASYYAQQAVEWLNAEKWTDWNNFFSKSNHNYCINTLSWNSIGNCDSNFGIPAIFKRELSLTTINNNQIEAQINVYWFDINKQQILTVKRIFNQLE